MLNPNLNVTSYYEIPLIDHSYHDDEPEHVKSRKISLRPQENPLTIESDEELDKEDEFFFTHRQASHGPLNLMQEESKKSGGQPGKNLRNSISGGSYGQVNNSTSNLVENPTRRSGSRSSLNLSAMNEYVNTGATAINEEKVVDNKSVNKNRFSTTSFFSAVSNNTSMSGFSNSPNSPHCKQEETRTSEKSFIRDVDGFRLPPTNIQVEGRRCSGSSNSKVSNSGILTERGLVGSFQFITDVMGTVVVKDDVKPMVSGGQGVLFKVLEKSLRDVSLKDTDMKTKSQNQTILTKKSPRHIQKTVGDSKNASNLTSRSDSTGPGSGLRPKIHDDLNKNSPSKNRNSNTNNNTNNVNNLGFTEADRLFSK